jgi:hypothetical protein
VKASLAKGDTRMLLAAQRRARATRGDMSNRSAKAGPDGEVPDTPD